MNQTFTIVIPPPNVTSILHMGHGLNNTIQVILIRYKRMSGYETLWIPGTDHAGIATQNVVERELAEEGKKKDDFSREDFEKRVWQTALRHQKSIIEQLKKMGCIMKKILVICTLCTSFFLIVCGCTENNDNENSNTMTAKE